MVVIQSRYKRLLVVVNPTKRHSGAYKRAEVQITYLEHSLGVSVIQLETSPTAKETISHITAVAQPNDLLLVAGGDGSLNTVATALVQIENDLRPDFLPIPVGTANDTFRSLNGTLSGKRALIRLLKSSRVTIHPLIISITTPEGKTTTQLAISHAGFNYTARFSSLMNGAAHKTGKLRSVPLVGSFLQDVATWKRTFKDISTYDSYEAGTTIARPIVDRIVMHSRVVGKYGRPHVKHTDDVFEDYISIDSTRRGVFFAVLRVFFGKSDGQKRKSISFIVGEKTLLSHVDGETYTIPSRATVTVSFSPESITTYSLLTARERAKKRTL
jgi:diacylglycerol kinase family enzyme